MFFILTMLRIPSNRHEIDARSRKSTIFHDKVPIYGGTFNSSLYNTIFPSKQTLLGKSQRMHLDKREFSNASHLSSNQKYQMSSIVETSSITTEMQRKLVSNTRDSRTQSISTLNVHKTDGSSTY